MSRSQFVCNFEGDAVVTLQCRWNVFSVSLQSQGLCKNQDSCNYIKSHLETQLRAGASIKRKQFHALHTRPLYVLNPFFIKFRSHITRWWKSDTKYKTLSLSYEWKTLHCTDLDDPWMSRSCHIARFQHASFEQMSSRFSATCSHSSVASTTFIRSFDFTSLAEAKTPTEQEVYMHPNCQT